ncbi:MAG: CoA transferase, partial [Betaproteobacteria bacterium]|nr:CoA transferase [Betaproteobacteria bacterium]
VGFFQEAEHPTEGRLRMTQVPGHWSETRPSIRRLAPGLGEHSASVLREAGFDEDRIRRLLAQAMRDISS